jgi:hypothetical protein
MPRLGSLSLEKRSVAVQAHDFRTGVRAWINARGHELVAPMEDDGVEAQLDHQRRQQLVSTGTIPRLVEL